MDQDTRWLIRYNEVKAFIEEISLMFVLVIPDTVLAHWVYLGAVLGYVLFMRKYYHLHEEYLASLKK